MDKIIDRPNTFCKDMLLFYVKDKMIQFLLLAKYEV